MESRILCQPHKKPLLSSDYNSISSVGPTGSSYADKYPQYESPRLDNSGYNGFTGGHNGIEENCYCVPYDQCLPHEISRKDGLLIDPRSNNKNIEAISLDDVVVTDGKLTQCSDVSYQDSGCESTLQCFVFEARNNYV